MLSVTKASRIAYRLKFTNPCKNRQNNNFQQKLVLITYAYFRKTVQKTEYAKVKRGALFPIETLLCIKKWRHNGSIKNRDWQMLEWDD